MSSATELRDYQRRAYEQVKDAYRAGKRSICVVMPTGSGKTRLGAEFVRGHVAKGGKVLWLAHRVELVAQAAERLLAEGIEHVGVITADVDNPAPDAAVQVASIQTLIARGELPEVSLVVFDEAHHYVAAEWGMVAKHYSNATRLGLTATPERSDGKPLGDLFDALVVGASPRELTELGYLVPCDVVSPAKYSPRKIAGCPVEAYLERANGKRAFVFAALVEHAAELAEKFRAAGVTAACISGETPADERAAAVEAFRRGELLVLCNVAIFTEGTDVPEAEVCILARGCGSAGTYLQIIGRVLRNAPGKLSALLIDLPGVCRRHGLPTDDRKYSLEGKRGIMLQRRGSAGMPGHGLGGMKRPEQIAAPLIKVAGFNADQKAKLDYLQEQYRQADRRGYKSGWAVFRFKERFGHAPWEIRQ